jgi:hypothetical protein
VNPAQMQLSWIFQQILIGLGLWRPPAPPPDRPPPPPKPSGTPEFATVDETQKAAIAWLGTDKVAIDWVFYLRSWFDGMPRTQLQTQGPPGSMP